MNFLLLAILISTAVYPQSDSRFQKVIGGPGIDRGVFVTPTTDGGYISVGATQSYGRGEDDVYLVKTDSRGRLKWSRSYGGPAEDNGWSVRETADGFILAGFTKSFGAGGFDFFLIKTDFQGEITWTNTFGGKGDERAWALIPAAGGGFVLVGETTGNDPGGDRDCLLVKTDSTGREEWSRTYGGPKGDRCFSIAQANDNGFVLAGQTYSEGAGDRDVFIIKTDPSGEKQWSRTFGGAASDVGHWITKLSNGGYLVTGYSTSLAKDLDDPYLIKIDEQGNTLWTRVLPMKGVNHTITGTQAVDGGFFLTGFSVYAEKRTNAALLIKTDVNGNLEWYEDILPTSAGRSLGYTVSATSDGGCVFTGHSTINSAGNLDLLLVKVRNKND